jgi:glyoxylase-like metal-dependent hydrolase (beta-lactamase superfamily II)
MPSGLNEDTAEALRSLDTLTGMTADVILPGHGDPYRDGVPAAVAAAKAAGRS